MIKNGIPCGSRFLNPINPLIEDKKGNNYAISRTDIKINGQLHETTWNWSKNSCSISFFYD